MIQEVGYTGDEGAEKPNAIVRGNPEISNFREPLLSSGQKDKGRSYQSPDARVTQQKLVSWQARQTGSGAMENIYSSQRYPQEGDEQREISWHLHFSHSPIACRASHGPH